MSSEPIEPTQVWTREEWRQEQPWGGMPNSPLRRFFKAEGFTHIYGGQRDRFHTQGSTTGRFTVNGPLSQWPRMPKVGDIIDFEA